MRVMFMLNILISFRYHVYFIEMFFVVNHIFEFLEFFQIFYSFLVILSELIYDQYFE